MSNLSFTNTQILRNTLLNRNLDDSYGVSSTLPVNFTNSAYGIQSTSDISVQDQLGVEETAQPIIDTIGTLNQYGPEQYSIPSIQTIINSIGSQLDYLGSFTPSADRGSLGLISILTGDDNGEGDTEMVSIARAQLRGMALETMGVKLQESTLGRINALDAINDPTALEGLLTGREKIIERDYQITVPGNPITRAAEYFARVSGTQLPVSYIPGNFFEENIEKGKVEGFLDKAGSAIGQVLNLDFNSHKKSYSQKLLQYTSGGQKSRLFKSVNYNKYQPNFDSSIGGVVNNVVGFIQGLAGLDPTDGAFYFGSPEVDPGTISNYDSQSNSQKAFMVSGPSKMVKMFEGDTPLNTYPQSGRTYLNGTSPSNTETQFIWLGDDDVVRGTIDGVSVQSNEKTIKEDSILGFTQKMVQDASALEGEARLKHPGTVISNVAYKYHDGYKVISKGNAVLGEDDDFCRVWTKDYGYDRHGRMVRFKGIQDTQRRVPGSVIRSQMMLNIAPTRDDDGDPINFGLDKEGKNLSKYMFSIENLAWVGSSKLQERPICEQGPNGGRVMWFPPYDLKYTDDNRASWTTHTFLGRPEPVYTYNNSERSGTISFKIVVDHPSIMNLLRKSLGDKFSPERKDEIFNSFIAGCKDFDIYELASEFVSLSMDEVQTLDGYLKQEGELKQDFKGEDKVVRESEKVVNEIKSDFETHYGKKTEDIQLYWFNDVPGPKNNSDTTPTTDYGSDIESYIGLFTDTDYIAKAESLSGSTETSVSWGEGEPLKFKEDHLEVIKEGVKKIKDEVTKTLAQNELFKFTIKLTATTSAVASQEYNNALATRRVNSLKKYLLGDSFEKNKDRITVVVESTGENKDFQGIDCSKLQTTPEPSNGVTPSDARIYSKSATYCRTGTASITVDGNPTKVDIKPGETEPTYENTVINIKTDPPNDAFDIILKTMHSECDYFMELKESDPVVFGSLADKLKYFQPGFHSTTPEGLNSRLTFLQQCLRPGETIKVHDEQGNEVTDLSSNTSFGRPPICVLRIGDFFHTKMVIDSINFSYDDALWDMNPEGIGMQPMIASVNIGAKFIGGHGIGNVINELQNALSFNYYANTEVYDPMATKTKGGRDPKKVEEIQNALKDRMTKKLSDALNDPELSKDDDEYIGNILESNPEILTYNQVYNNFAETLNKYSNELITQIQTLHEKYGDSALEILFSKREERYNIFSETKYSTTDSIRLRYLGRDDYDYNEKYADVISKLEEQIDGEVSDYDEVYLTLDNKINFNENKIDEYFKISRYVMDEFKKSFSEWGVEIQSSLKSVYESQRRLQKFLEAFNVVLGSEIDGYKGEDNVWVVKFLNNLTQDNGDLSGDVLSSMMKADELWDTIETEVTSKYDLTGIGSEISLKTAGEFNSRSSSVYYGELLPLFLQGTTFDIDKAVSNNGEFDRRIRKKYGEYLNVLKNRKVKNIDISKFIWEPINNTTQVYDFKITESVNPSNATIIEEFRNVGIKPSELDVEDSKKIWIEFPISGLKSKGISLSPELPTTIIIPQIPTGG